MTCAKCGRRARGQLCRECELDERFEEEFRKEFSEDDVEEGSA